MTNPNDVTTPEEEVESQSPDLSYDEEFDAAFAKSKEPVDEDEPEQDDDTTQEQEEVDEGDDGGDEPPVTEPETASTKTDAKPKEKAPAKDAAAAASADDPFSWIASLPEEVKKQAENLKHSALSDRSRVAAYNRHLADLRRELEEARLASRPVSKPAEQTPKGTSGSAAPPELPAKFKQLQEDFPEFAEAVQELFEHNRQGYEARLSEVVTPIEAARKREQYDRFWDAVTEGSKEILATEDGSYWDVNEVVASDDFKAWLELQPKSLQAAARVPDETEALYVLRRYRQDYDAAVAQMGLSDTATDAATSTAQADKTKQRRNKVKATSAVPGSKPGAVDPKTTSGTYEDLFNSMVG